MSTFPEDVIAAVLHHMNDDHTDDSVLIMRAFVDPAASAATMTGLDNESGHWEYVSGGETRQGTVAWPNPISTRPEIRQAVTILYEQACDKLGLPQREH